LETLLWILPDLSYAEWLAHALVFIVNITLFLLAKPIVRLSQGATNRAAKIQLFRSLNILVLILHIVDLALLRLSADYEDYFISIGLTLLALYTALFVYHLSAAWARKRFGNERVIDEKTLYLDTYSTRLVGIILIAVITCATLYALIKIWGADSMLEATGIFGISAAFVAFTSSIWAPDIISGLIILNTKILEDGDVVVVDGHPDEYIISKVTLFYVILYNVRNNHRTLIRNRQFTESRIDNLSRIASSDGVRQALTYKIGYPAMEGLSKDERQVALKSFLNSVDRMFEAAFESCCAIDNIKVEPNSKFEWSMTEAGDFALEYTLWVYLARIPNTKITSTIRRHLMGTLYKVNEMVYKASVAEGIELATPNVANVALTQSVDSPKNGANHDGSNQGL